MRIGIDARALAGRRTGIANYVHNSIRLLSQIAPEHRYILYSNRPLAGSCSSSGANERIDCKFRFVPGSLWHLARLGGLISRDCLDVFWSTFPILPMRVPSGVLKVVTVYDVVWLRFRETMTRYNYLVHKMCAERAIAGADAVVVISKSTGEDLVEMLGIPPTKIQLVYPGISDVYRPLDQQKAASYISNKYGVPHRYLATVGTVEPRKNLGILVAALRILKQQRQFECPLLIAGANGWKTSRLYQEIESSGLTDREIRFMGYIPDQDLPAFYSGAQLFLFPSLYEGFGLPPLEAMACGTPVIASNARCIPEVLGAAAIVKEPTDDNGFASAIADLLKNDALRCSMREVGISRARSFGWRESTTQLLRVFERVTRGDGPALSPNRVLGCN